MLFIVFIATLPYKSENAFEKSLGWAISKKLLKKGFDLTGKDKNILTDNRIINYSENLGIKLRGKFNVFYHLFLENPINLIIDDIFPNIDTKVGTRSVQRTFLRGQLLTEHFNNTLDWIHEKTPTPTGIVKGCKSIFSNNRTDLGD